MPAIATFRILPGSPFFLVTEDGKEIVSEGEELRNERDSLRFIEAIAHERGWVLSVFRNPDGHVERVEASVAPGAVRFSMDSVRAIDDFRSEAGRILRELAIKRVTAEGRQLVTAEDVLASIKDAIRSMLHRIDPATPER